MNIIGDKITASTYVTFPAGGIKGKSSVLGVVKNLPQENRIALLFHETPFHPVDKHWPDQPADRGHVMIGENKFELKDCQVLAIHKQSQEIKESNEITRKEKENWSFVVAHIIDPGQTQPNTFINAEVIAEVDEEYRQKLSLHHTACHLAALAFNSATKDFWGKKAPKYDSIGSPDIDQLAIDKSFIFEDRSEDRYRFGSSIKKKGLDTQSLFGNLVPVQEKVNQQLASWIALASEVEIVRSQDGLDAMRKWRCKIPEGLAEIPCGGTHMKSLSVFASINYQLSEEPGEKGEKRLFAKTVAQCK